MLVFAQCRIEDINKILHDSVNKSLSNLQLPFKDK